MLDSIDTPLRIWPHEIDTNQHVNNGAYLTLMDFGRFDLLIRAGIFQSIRRAGWFPVVVAETIQFRRSLKLGQRFVIRTQILGWTEKDFFMEQTFLRHGEIYARGVVKGRFLRKEGGSVTVEELNELAGYDPAPASPELKQWIRDWDAAQQREREAMKAQSPVTAE
jgi:YbgC/YbaW family acyl-CoA thioester hydrolase